MNKKNHNPPAEQKRGFAACDENFKDDKNSYSLKLNLLLILTKESHIEMHSPPCILIVDDNPINIKLLAKSLEKDTYTILKAQNGQDGYNLAIKENPDLILLDIMMPEMDGYEACKLLKSEEKTKHIPVIFITAMADMSNKIKGLDLGAIDYITKPFNSVEVLARVRTQLKLKKIHEENISYQKILMESQKASSIGILSEGIAHNFNNLLSINSCYAEMLRNNMGEDSSNKIYIDKILKTTDRMKKIVRHLLDFVEGGEVLTHSLKINKVVTGAVNFFKESHSEKKELKTTILLEDSDRETIANEKQLFQALLNILINAREAMNDRGEILVKTGVVSPPKEIKDKVTASAEEFISIEVKDTGKGIKEEDIEKLFLPFFTTKNTVGVGLGLSTSFGIIKSHGGTILVDSTEGEGSTFKIYLPLKNNG